jgi:DNA gyrase subunit A
LSDDAPFDPVSGASGGAIAPIAIEDELKRSYLDYAMSVIVSRALPDARDGLKPVHRRILFSMYENGFTSSASYRKSARIVGDVIGKYHPHGDQSVYDALVRMAQPFSMGLLLVDGQGNFGSVDNDPPAAMRYTESRMTKAAEALLADLDKDTVDFQDNYDGGEREPMVLPSRIPNLLVNGSGGIAVGMATNIPPHNLGEVVDACLAMIDDPAITLEALLEIVPGPDFPTGGQIIGRTGARQALMTGRGSVIMRSVSSVETIRKDREAIIITEIPYQVNKASLLERIAELVREKRIEGISDLRDESDRDGMRMVIELKRDAPADVVLNQLHRYTPLQSSFGVNMLALDHGRPLQMGLRQMLDIFLVHREEVVVRRTKFELNKARNRGHVLVGLAIAVVNIDEVIHIIRSSANPNEARERLQARDWPAGDMLPLIALIQDPRTVLVEEIRVRLSDEQARAILALTLSRLTGLGRDEIFAEAEGLAKAIQGYLEILASRERVMAIVREARISR